MRIYFFALFFICYIGSGVPQAQGANSINLDFFAKVRALKEENKARKALELIEASLKRPTIDKLEFPLLLMQKALLARDLGEADLAEESFRSILKTESSFGEYVHFELAKIYAQKKQPDKQALELKEVNALSPNSKMQNEVNYELAKLDIENKKFKEARTPLVKLEKRSRREEPYPEIIYQLARVEKGLHQQGPFCKWAKKLYSHYPDFKLISEWGFRLSENRIENSPTQCEASFEEKRVRIKNLQWAGLNQKAFEEIQQLKKGDDESKEEASRLEISYYLHEGDADKALSLLRPQYETQKNDPQFLSIVANAAAKLGDSQAAVGSYYLAYKLAPRGKFAKQALYQAAFMSYQFQDYDGAARKFQEFMKAFAGSGLARDARWHLAWIRYLRGDFEESYKALSILKHDATRSRKLSRSFPFDRVNFWMGMSLYRLNKYMEAREIFEPLAKDKLLGFYSIAALARIKKIDELYPRVSQQVMLDENMRMGRYQGSLAFVPSDDPAWFQEVLKQQFDPKINDVANEKETKEPVVLKNETAETEQEILGTKEQRETGESQDSAAEISTELNDEGPTQFSNPVLLSRFERARYLMIVGQLDWARWDLFDIEKKTRDREHLRTLMQEYEIVESFNRSSYIGHVTFGGQRGSYGIEMSHNLWEHAYPKAFSGFVYKYSRDFNVPSELIWGIMRAESQYKKDVVSPVGALGLMQVMPFTATKVAESFGEKNFDSKKLLQPEGAIKVGAKYLQRLLKKFDGNIAMVAAGYNAGPHRVENWITNFGQLDLDEFIEHIPYLETRNYVKKVVSNFMTYSKLYEGKKDDMITLSVPIKSKIGANVAKTSVKVSQKETWEDL